jgi:hypothetical protein
MLMAAILHRRGPLVISDLQRRTRRRAAFRLRFANLAENARAMAEVVELAFTHDVLIVACGGQWTNARTERGCRARAQQRSLGV